MSKLFKLKQWVTLTDAAKYLSLTLDEEVSQLDLLRLVLDGHLTLSVLFLGNVRAKKGKKIALSEVQFKEIPSPFDESVVVISNAIKAISKYFRTEYYVELESEVSVLNGLFDLPLIGGERDDIEYLYYKQIDIPDPGMVSIDGTFVECGDVIYQIQKRFEDGFIEKMREGENHNRENEYFPAGGLPEDAPLVFRTDVLNEFVESLSDKKPQQLNKTAETYLDPNHNHYSNELAIAVKAWRTLYDNGGTYKPKKSHKVQIKATLAGNGLSNAAINRIATLVNPNKDGGAPSTEEEI